MICTYLQNYSINIESTCYNINEPVGPIYKFICIEKKKQKKTTFYYWKTVNKAQKFLKSCNICHNQYLAIDNITCSALQYAKIIAEQKKKVR